MPRCQTTLVHANRSQEALLQQTARSLLHFGAAIILHLHATLLHGLVRWLGEHRRHKKAAPTVEEHQKGLTLGKHRAARDGIGPDVQEDPAHWSGGRRAAPGRSGKIVQATAWPTWPRRVRGVRSRPTHDSREVLVPFKANAARRHRIPKQRHRVTKWAEYDASLRQRGSLTVWFTNGHRDLERMLADRGVEVDHVSLYRWVQRFAPELEKRMRRHLRLCGGPWHVDETYIRVDGGWRYLYRAVDGTGQTIDFLLQRQARQEDGQALLPPRSQPGTGQHPQPADHHHRSTQELSRRDPGDETG